MLGKRSQGRVERGKRKAERNGDRQGHKKKRRENSGNRSWQLEIETEIKQRKEGKMGVEKGNEIKKERTRKCK